MLGPGCGMGRRNLSKDICRLQSGTLLITGGVYFI